MIMVSSGTSAAVSPWCQMIWVRDALCTVAAPSGARAGVLMPPQLTCPRMLLPPKSAPVLPARWRGHVGLAKGGATSQRLCSPQAAVSLPWNARRLTQST